MSDPDFDEFRLIDVLYSTRTALARCPAVVPELDELRKCNDQAIQRLEEFLYASRTEYYLQIPLGLALLTAIKDRLASAALPVGNHDVPPCAVDKGSVTAG